jgi:hypothetical protein
MAQQTKDSSTTRGSRSNSRSARSSATRSPNGGPTAARAPSKRSNGSRSNATKRATSTRATASRPSSRRSSSSSSRRSTSSKSSVDKVTDPTRQRVKGASSAIGEVAEKAKVPALAAVAGLTGLAGGVVLANRNSRKRVLGVPMPTKSATKAVSKSLADTAKNVEGFGEGIGSLAAEVRKVREGIAAGVTDGDRENRPSPIEVVLQGLTRRR